MTVTFEKNMNLVVTMEVFWSNKENKLRFIIMLGEELSKSGCTVFHDTGDADCLIVKKAMAARAENKEMIQICWFFFCISYMKENMMFTLLQGPKKLKSTNLGCERC